MNPSLSIFALVLFVMTVELCQPMNQRDYQAQVIDAADRLTDELLGYFGELLQSVVRDVTVGIANTAPSTASKNRAVAEKCPQALSTVGFEKKTGSKKTVDSPPGILGTSFRPRTRQGRGARRSVFERKESGDAH